MKKHYGWAVCAACMLMHFCAAGMSTSVLSIFLPYIKAEFDLTATEISLITTMRSVSTTLAMLAAGKYFKWLSLRVGATVSYSFLVAGYALLSQANSALMCYISAVLLGVTYALGGLIPISILLRRWFHDRHGTATAIAACGSGVCSALSPIIITRLAERQGLQNAFLLTAGFALICTAIIFLVLRNSPDELGLLPYQEDGYEEKQKKSRPRVDSDLTRRETQLLMIAMFMIGMAGTTSVNHLAIHFRTAGYASMLVAAALSINGVILTAGKLGFGYLSDRFGTYRINYVFVGSWIISSFLAAVSDGFSNSLLFISALLHGFGTAVGTVGIIIWAGELSPSERYARSIRHSQTLFSAGTLLGSPIPGIIADLTGSYSLAYVFFGVSFMLVLITVQTIYRKHIHLILTT